jgi:hypothetical protein
VISETCLNPTKPPFPKKENFPKNGCAVSVTDQLNSIARLTVCRNKSNSPTKSLLILLNCRLSTPPECWIVLSLCCGFTSTHGNNNTYSPSDREELYADVDLTQGYEFLDNELQKIKLKGKKGKNFTDKLVKVLRKDGTDVSGFRQKST